MKKVTVIIFFICFYVFYLLTRVSNESINISKDLPDVSSAKVISESSSPLPIASKSINQLNSNDNKSSEGITKTTPLSFIGRKSVSPRITKEEIQKAKIFKVIPMKVNGEPMELVIVEYHGSYYDASDGVMIFMPRDLSVLYKK